MPDPTYTNRRAGEIIENEGIGYAVLDYCDGNNFIDPETARLWSAAETALAALHKYLYDQGALDHD